MTKEELIAEFEKEFPSFNGVGAPFPIFEETPNRLHIQSFILKAFEAGEQAERERNKEVCICAAVKTADGSKIIRGQRHHNCLWDIHEQHLIPGEQGFVTSTGRFVSRLEGRRLQDAAGLQSVSPDGYQNGTLYSEDLY